MSDKLFDIVNLAPAARVHDVPRSKLAVDRVVIDYADQNRPASALPKIIDTVAFIDTVVLYCWQRLPVEAFQAMRKQYRERLYVTHFDVLSRKGAQRGPRKTLRRWLIAVHQPDLATLRALKDLQRKRFVITAVHIAIDFVCRRENDAAQVHNFLTHHLVQRRRRGRQKSHIEIATAYANYNKRAPRNSALYMARSKTGAGPCCHFELRFFGAQPCKRAGVGTFDDIISGVDAQALLAQQARFVCIDGKAVRRAAEKAARRNRRRGQGSTVAEISNKLLSLLNRRVRHEDFRPDRDPISRARAQELYDAGPYWRHCLRHLMDWQAFAPVPRWHPW